MPLTVFEDDRVANLFPLVYTRHVSQMLCGTRTLLVHIEDAWSEGAALWSRGMLAGMLAEQAPDREVNQPYETFLMVNGRLLANRALAERIPLEGPDAAFVSAGQLVAMRLSGKHAAALRFDGPFSTESIPPGVPVEETAATLIGYPWDLVAHNGPRIAADFASFGAGDKEGLLDESAVLLGADKIHLAPGSRIMPGAVLDAEEGPVWIDEGALVMPHSYIQGPAYIGPGCRIKASATIYEGTSLGPVCKVGGEVEESILFGYSNKQHDGFLGHAAIGRWVNLGAATNNSDLKNNYGPVRVTINGKEMDSGCQFVGATLGDHSKTAIGTVLNTGTVVGVGCNVFGGGFPPKYIPSFSWGGGGGLCEHAFDKFVATAERVMARRKIVLGPAERELLRRVFEETAKER